MISNFNIYETTSPTNKSLEVIYTPNSTKEYTFTVLRDGIIVQNGIASGKKEFNLNNTGSYKIKIDANVNGQVMALESGINSRYTGLI